MTTSLSFLHHVQAQEKTTINLYISANILSDFHISLHDFFFLTVSDGCLKTLMWRIVKLLL